MHHTEQSCEAFTGSVCPLPGHEVPWAQGGCSAAAHFPRDVTALQQLLHFSPQIFIFFFFKGRKRNKVLKEKRYIFLTAAEPLLTDPTWLLDRIPAREICMCEESRVRNLLGSPVLHTVREMLNGEGVFLQGNTSTRPDPVSPSTQPGARSHL